VSGELTRRVVTCAMFPRVKIRSAEQTSGNRQVGTAAFLRSPRNRASFIGSKLNVRIDYRRPIRSQHAKLGSPGGRRAVAGLSPKNRRRQHRASPRPDVGAPPFLPARNGPQGLDPLGQSNPDGCVLLRRSRQNYKFATAEQITLPPSSPTARSHPISHSIMKHGAGGA
jgi:hypothetical protein